MEQSNVIQQGTDQWARLRLGKFTSSKWHLFDVNSKVPGEPSAGVKSYVMELLWELVCGHNEGISTWAMKQGHEWEPFAKKEIERRYKSEMYNDEFIQHPTLPYYGGSPDGFIKINGMPVTPEVKCPTGSEHLINIQLLKDVETCKKGWPEIYGQVQSNMYLQDTQLALAVSFQHEAPPELMYKDLQIPRDSAYIATKLIKMAEAWEWMQAQAKIFNIDILAKYDEYSKPAQSVKMQAADDTDAYAFNGGVPLTNAA